MAEPRLPLQEIAREWKLLVCPQCGAEEHAPPSDCGYCETGGKLVAITVVQKATAGRPEEEDPDA